MLPFVAGCALGADAGALQRSPGDLRGGSMTAHGAIGGGGSGDGRYLASLGLDTRVDVASGSSRWALGASMLGGVRAGPAYLDARVGVWNALVSSTNEAALVPSFELGAFVPLARRFDEKHPEHGESNSGAVFGIREDFDRTDYFTVFVGYAAFVMLGY